MRPVSMVFVLLFLAWQSASAEDLKQPTNREALGVGFGRINDDETAKVLGVQPPHRTIVGYVAEKSPAKRAGIASGDVIVKLNGIEISEPRDVPRVIADIPAGTSVPVVFIREGKEIAATLTFGTTARIRTPTCEELFDLMPYRKPMPADAIDRSFGKGSGDLNANDFDDALAIVSRCRKVLAPPPLGSNAPMGQYQSQLNAVSILAQQLGERKNEALRQQRILIDRSQLELNRRLNERKKQMDAKIQADQAAAEALAKAEECRLQCRQKLTAMLTELRSLAADQAGIQRLRELGREQRTLFASMPMDVQASLTALNETFVSEYGKLETVAKQAEDKISEAKRHAAEVAENEQVLKTIYITYLMLDFCAKRFPDFSGSKATAKDAAKNKETALSAGQIDAIWRISAEAFAKIMEPMLQTTGQLYAECRGASNTLMSLIMSGVAQPSQGQLPKKDL